ncbi:MAG: DUF937 domain-containing protein [Gemmataceae bacterium]|nr:DUF937 domain-containing protein [Gemmataceae bacterium]
MNLVESIQQELSGAMLNKLSSLTGQGETKTKMAVTAAVPAILSGLGKLAGVPGGAEKIASMARKFTPEELSKIPDLTSGQAGAIFEEGKSALTGLFDGGKLNLLLGVLSKFLSLDAETVKKLIGFLAPIIFGTMTKKFGTAGLTGSTVSALFEEQKGNIADAMPPGLSLDAVPGFGGTAAPAPGGGSMLLPLFLVLAIAGGAYWWFNIRPGQVPNPLPKAPDVSALAAEAAAFTKDLSGVFASLTESLNTVKDAATAETALPKLKDAGEKAAGLKVVWDKIPAAAQGPAKAALTTGLTKLKELVEKVLAIPGVGDKLKPTLDEVMKTLTALGA